MARQRFIHPEIWDDPDLGRVSPIAFVLYIGCFSNADDEGRLLGDPAYLKSQIFRYRNVTLEEVLEARTELTKACRSYVVYAHNDVEYVCFKNWDEYQKPRFPKPSKLPPPPGFRRRKAPKQEESPTVTDTEALTADATEAITEAPREWVGFGLGLRTNPSSSSSLDHDDDAIRNRLRDAGWSDGRIAIIAGRGHLELAVAWLDHAEADPGIQNPGAYSFAMADTGQEPTTNVSTLAPGATGTRSAKPTGHECPHCGVVKAGPNALEEHIANVHYDLAA